MIGRRTRVAVAVLCSASLLACSAAALAAPSPPPSQPQGLTHRADARAHKGHKGHRDHKAPSWAKHGRRLKSGHLMILTLRRPVRSRCSLIIHHRGDDHRKWTYATGRGRIQFAVKPSRKTRPGVWVLNAKCIPDASTAVHKRATKIRVRTGRHGHAFLVGHDGPRMSVPIRAGDTGPPVGLPPVGGKGGATGDDYPYRHLAQDSRLDPWGEYVRECTSFAAWALHSRNGFDMPFYANAIDWGTIAARRGYAVNSTPALGAVAWNQHPPYGHVAWVSAVSGGSVTVQEYNYYGNGTYSTRTVPASSFRYIHFKDLTPAPAPPANPHPDPTPAPSATTYPETTGGVTHTWTNYTNAGGTQGPSIASHRTVRIACKLTGFRVADGNTWWYRIASSPWSNHYYASADAFYNNGQTSGSLIGTPFVDSKVRNC